MRASDLKRGIRPAPVCLLTGGDGYWTCYASQAITASVPQEDRDLRVDSLDNPDVKDIVFSAGMPSLTGEGKYVVVTGRTSKLTKEEERALVEYCEDPAAENTLILCDEKGVFNCVKPYAAIIECAALDAQETKDYLYEYAAKLGLRIQPPAMALLCDYCNQDAGRASRELDKICDYAPEGGLVTQEIVKLLVAPDERAKAYELTSALSSGNKSAAAEYLTRLSASGVQSAAILRALASTYRGLLFLRISSLSDNEAAQALGVKPFAVKKMRPLAKKYSAVTLKSLTDGLNDLEYHFKSGKLSVDEALNLAICRIMGVRINV